MVPKNHLIYILSPYAMEHLPYIPTSVKQANSLNTYKRAVIEHISLLRLQFYMFNAHSGF